MLEGLTRISRMTRIGVERRQKCGGPSTALRSGRDDADFFQLVLEAACVGGVEGLISRVDSLLVILLRRRHHSTNLLVNRSAAFGALESVFVLRILL
jgi:hypothetical protein